MQVTYHPYTTNPDNSYGSGFTDFRQLVEGRGFSVRQGENGAPSENQDDFALSGRPWTQVGTIAARFPSCRFAVSSPSSPDPLPFGPFFFLGAEAVLVRVSWMEFQGSRDDGVPVEPDVIEVVIWPR